MVTVELVLENVKLVNMNQECVPVVMLNKF